MHTFLVIAMVSIKIKSRSICKNDPHVMLIFMTFLSLDMVKISLKTFLIMRCKRLSIVFFNTLSFHFVCSVHCNRVITKHSFKMVIKIFVIVWLVGMSFNIWQAALIKE